jgi:hypothetical protein
MLQNEKQVWLLSVGTATIFFWILPELAIPETKSLFYYGFCIFLFFGAFSGGILTVYLASSRITKALLVFSSVLLAGLYLTKNIVILALLVFLLGFVWSSVYRRVVSHLPHKSRSLSAIYFWIFLLMAIKLFPVGNDFAYVWTLVCFLLLAFQPFPDQEFVSSKKESSLFSTSAIVSYGMLFLSLATECVLLFWLLVTLSQELKTQHAFPVFGILFGLFFFRRFTGKPILLKGREGTLFMFSILVTVGLGFLFPLSTPWLFLIAYILGQAWLPSLIGRTKEIAMDVKQTGVFLAILASCFLIAGFLLMRYHTFLKSIGIPDQLLNLAVQQAIVKELAYFSALIILVAGFFFLGRKNKTGIRV